MSEEPCDLNSLWQKAEQLDLTGLKCPMPVLVTRRALNEVAPGCLVAVTVTDALAPLDLRHLCEREGHQLVGETLKSNGAKRLLIRRGPRL